jgi:hypothetical protein
MQEAGCRSGLSWEDGGFREEADREGIGRQVLGERTAIRRLCRIRRLPLGVNRRRKPWSVPRLRGRREQ